MLSHQEMIGLQAEKHELTDEDEFQTSEQYVLHLMHCAAYAHAARVVRGKAVLDLGCNTGYGTKMLAARASRTVGLDVSERAIAVAKAKHGDSGIDFGVTDGTRIPFPDNSFDLITCFQIIEHLVEYEGFMSEVKRVLTPDGVVIFTTPNALQRLDPGMKPWNEFHVREFSGEELQQTLDDHFDNVGILALYGSDLLHTIVAERADRIRRRARARAARVNAAPSESVSSNSATPPATESSVPPLDFLKANCSADDFEYRAGGFTEALEFMAVCSATLIATWMDSLAW
jgi:SAM-dependent methyltransferase